MKHGFYRERDYALGQRMLTLRTAMGLTQAAVAALLGVSRNAVSRWETGESYPKADHLTHFISVALAQHAFPAGREADEIQALWRTARQKVLLDERWLQQVLSQLAPLPRPVLGTQAHTVNAVRAARAGRGPQVDWGDALAVPTFYGRAAELTLLSRWIVEDRCRVVSVLGMGGIGKSALAVTVMYRVAPQFEVVIWRSLRDAPPCDALVADCLQVLAPQPLPDLPDSLEGRLGLLMEQLRDRPVLLVLDNGEMLLEERTGMGRMRAGFEGYARLLRQVGETAHQSCLLLTSREKPADLVPLEGSQLPVRTVRLGGLDAGAGAQILVEKDVEGSFSDRARLVEAYGGNPLALKIVAQSIVELFGGEIVPFLMQGKFVFGGVRELLREQFERLSTLEQRVFFWLAILREPVHLEDLLAVLSEFQAPVQVLEALDGLRRRSVIERGQRAGSFTLQSVVLEYVTARLIAEASREIAQGQLDRLIQHGLCLAHAKEYVRQAQEHLLVGPLVSQLHGIYRGQANVEAQLRALLDDLRSWAQESQGYGPANLVTLLRVLRGDGRGLDLSRLALRGVWLQGIEMQDADLSRVALQDSVFTEPLDAIRMVVVSRNGQHWAAGNRRGEVRVWGEGGKTLQRVWQAHLSDMTALAFSPDGRTLATVSFDTTIKLWNVKNGTLLWTGWQTGGIIAVAFAPDGHLLASGGNDGRIHLWDVQRGVEVQTLADQRTVIGTLAWSPDGRLLASGCIDGNIWMWNALEAVPGPQVQKLVGHTNWVSGLVFAPDSRQLASASFDGTVKLWDTEHGTWLHTVAEHSDQMLRVVWSPDGRMLASCSFDHTIWLWDVTEGRSHAVLHGHTGVIYGLAFAPDSHTLLSGSDDGTIRVWDVACGQSVRIIVGYVATLFDVDWSPDDTRLAAAGADTVVTIWNRASGTPPRILRGHRWIVHGVAWSPDGLLLATAGYDNSIGVWDTVRHLRLYELRAPDGADTMFMSVAWSPNGRFLACGSYQRGVHVWDMTTRTRSWVGRTAPTLLRRVVWSPDGTQLAGAGGDGYVYVWDAKDGGLLRQLAGHDRPMMDVAWSPDGAWLGAGGGGRAGGGLFVWDVVRGERVQTFEKHPGVVTAVTWSSRGNVVISGGSDGMLRWWDVESGRCIRVHAAHQSTVQALKISRDGRRLASCGDDGAIQLIDLHGGEQLQTLRRDRPYERMNITGLTGVTEAQRVSLIRLGAVEHVGDRAAPVMAPDPTDAA
jgi:WD40 repeat protein/transcriptional regulator with XRE-family HTH domain